jgi:Zn-dependent peptidase ImmA (M78 family)
MTWHRDATGAARRAATLRGRLGYGLADALCPFDVAERLKVEVRFQNESPRMEGFYAPGRPPRIFISSLRPAGRQRYTAAHELGHHEYGHGASLDAELNDNTREEFLANRFARALLMPKLAVANAFQRRGWDPRQTTAEQAFLVAQDLGVGFTTLIDNMSQTLRLLGPDEADRLTKLRLAKVRATVAGHEVEHDFFRWTSTGASGRSTFRWATSSHSRRAPSFRVPRSVSTRVVREPCERVGVSYVCVVGATRSRFG